MAATNQSYIYLQNVYIYHYMHTINTVLNLHFPFTDTTNTTFTYLIVNILSLEILGRGGLC
jgi:hypothetical protein